MSGSKKPETTATSDAAPVAESPLSRIRTAVEHRPPRIFLYGVHGIGKTTFASRAPDPILICTEEGAEEIEVAKFPRVESSDDVLSCLRSLYKEPHDYKTVVIDSADWLEDIVAAEVVKSHSASELAYGKDSTLIMQRINEVLIALNYLRDKRSMSAIIVAHSEIKRFDSPLTEPYDRYQPKLIKSVSALLQEWADAVLFATYDVTVKTEKVGFNAEVRPAFFAKNRYALPLELPLDWNALATRIPYFGKERT
jgi:AAA domain